MVFQYQVNCCCYFCFARLGKFLQLFTLGSVFFFPSPSFFYLQSRLCLFFSLPPLRVRLSRTLSLFSLPLFFCFPPAFSAQKGGEGRRKPKKAHFLVSRQQCARLMNDHGCPARVFLLSIFDRPVHLFDTLLGALAVLARE